MSGAKRGAGSGAKRAATAKEKGSSASQVMPGATSTVASNTGLAITAKTKSAAKLGASYWKLWSATAISNLGDGISLVAYPWLASATTRSPLLIALIPLAQRLPWLIFTLPAGVITDRYDRRKIIVAMDFLRGILTLAVGFGVLAGAKSLPALTNITQLQSTHFTLYFLLLITALLFGFMEVLRDNSAQTLMPSLVESQNLEKANGRMWSAESLTNSFIGPAVGSLLLGIALALPFFVDAGTFFFCAGLIATLSGSFQPKSAGVGETTISPSSDDNDRPHVAPNSDLQDAIDAVVASRAKSSFRTEINEGVAWLWKHDLIRSLAISLGLLNFAGSIFGAIYILYAQEILHTSVFIFALLGTAGAVGGVAGGMLGPKLSARLGSARSVSLALIFMPSFTLVMGLTSSWQVVWVATAAETFFAVLWNVVTVAFRQSIIPPELLGRVNSVYRMLGWGSIPIGTLVGGLVVTINSHFLTRDWALRSTFIIAAAVGGAIFFYAAPKLTSAKFESAHSVTPT